MGLLKRMVYGRRALMAAALSSSVITAAVTLWWNARLSGIIDTVSRGIPPSAHSVLWTLAAMCLLGATHYAKGIISGYTYEAMTHDLRMGYARHLSQLPAEQSETLNAGEQISALQNEIAGVSAYLNSNLFQLFDNTVSFILTFGFLISINPTVALSANLPALAIVVYVFFSSRIIGTATARAQEAKEGMNRHADTLLTLFPVMRLYDATRLTLGGFAHAVSAWEGHTIRAERLRARLMSLSAMMSAIPLLLLLLIGGHMVIGGALSPGTLYIFINLSGNVSGVMMNMPGHIGAFRQFVANMGRLGGRVCL